MTRTMIRNSPLRVVIPAAALMALVAPCAQAAWTLNMTPGISALSRQIYDLHMLMFWWCVGIAIPVFGFMIYSMVRFRKSKGAVADTNLLHSTRVEVIWTILPVLILISMAVPAARTLVETENSSGSQLTIRVTGYQWKWGYEYVGSGVTVLSTLDRASDHARQLQSGAPPVVQTNSCKPCRIAQDEIRAGKVKWEIPETRSAAEQAADVLDQAFGHDA